VGQKADTQLALVRVPPPNFCRCGAGTAGSISSRPPAPTCPALGAGQAWPRARVRVCVSDCQLIIPASPSCLRQCYYSVPLQLWNAISEVKSNMSPCILFTLSPAEQTALRLVPHFRSGRPNFPSSSLLVPLPRARTCLPHVRATGQVLGTPPSVLRGHLTFPRLRRQLVGASGCGLPRTQ
jgi:hypothetical protein